MARWGALRALDREGRSPDAPYREGRSVALPTGPIHKTPPV
jgi:hypothetical protein